MNRWLLKTEPEAYSFADLEAEGTGTWDGVRNHQAAANLRAMAVGDELFIYHSVSEKAVVGTAHVTGAPAPDPTDPTGRWVAVRLEAVERWDRPVTLKMVKAEPALADMALVRQSRLSVCPVTDAEAAVLRSLAGR